MSMWLLPFTLAGLIGFAMLLSSVLLELCRAARQAARVAAISIRVRLRERRRPTIREWWYCFCREITDGYDSLIIGFIEVPRDPMKPIRARLPR